MILAGYFIVLGGYHQSFLAPWNNSEETPKKLQAEVKSLQANSQSRKFPPVPRSRSLGRGSEHVRRGLPPVGADELRMKRMNWLLVLWVAGG